MCLGVHAGQRHLALRQYRQFCDALRRELDAEPEQRSQALYAQILRGDAVPEPRVQPPTGTATVAHLTHSPEGPLLVGREVEFEEFRERLEKLFSGRGGLVLVCGETGAGKSRMAAAVSAYAARLGATVLWGCSYLQEAQHPFSHFCSALEGFARGTGCAGLHTPLSESASGLARLLHASVSPSDRRRPSQGTEVPDRRRVFPAIADFFKSLAGKAPVLVVLDDLHLDDEASLQLVLYLATLARDIPLLLLGTMNSEQAGPPDSGGHVEPQLAQEGFAVRMDLPPLSFPASCELVTALLGAPAEQAVLQRVYALAGGNPHYTQEAVQALRGRDQLREIDGQWRLQKDTAELRVRKGNG
jgi:predicted ATPase